MLRLSALLLAAFAINADAHKHGEKLRGVFHHGKEEWKNHREGGGRPHFFGGRGGGGGWPQRMQAVRETIETLGYNFQWEPVNELGRSIMFTSPTSVMCLASSVSMVKDTDMIVLVSSSSSAETETSSPVVKTYKCSDDQAYLSTGKGEITFDLTITDNAHAMLLVESTSAEKTLALISSARYAAVPHPTTEEESNNNNSNEEDTTKNTNTVTSTTTTSNERSLSSTNETTNTAPANCGGESQPACESEAEKKADEKVQEGEANFAMAVAFFGCVAIVRSANKYARDPS